MNSEDPERLKLKFCQYFLTSRAIGEDFRYSASDSVLKRFFGHTTHKYAGLAGIVGLLDVNVEDSFRQCVDDAVTANLDSLFDNYQ